MKAFVFTDASLARHAGRFVWLAIDGEKAKNAALMKALKIPAYPTLYIMDPASQRVALRWVGAPNVPQLHRLLENGQAAVRGKGSSLDARLARADSLYGAGEDSSAAQAYLHVLSAAPLGWPHYARVTDAALFALSNSKGEARCTELASEAMERLAGTTAGASAAVNGLSCALQLPAEHPERKDLIAKFEARCSAIVRDSAIPLSTDDRSGIFLTLADAREDAKDEEGRKRILSECAALLEKAAAAAKTPDERVVFDSHRLAVYRELGQPEKAVPMLEASQRDFPEDYNPPARLAIAYRSMKQYDKALASSDRALAMAYGPRKLLLYDNRVDILIAQGDSTAARGALQTAIREGEAMPEGQRSAGRIAGLKRRLVAIGGSPTQQ
jgi:tetratricopeptide (TPR) repeat protein